MKRTINPPEIYIGKKIRITHCWAQTPLYENCKDGSIHKIVKPPFDFTNSGRGVWILSGTGEEIRLFPWEFEFVKQIKRSK